MATRGATSPCAAALTDYLASKGISSEGQELLITNGFRQGLEDALPHAADR